MGGIRGGWELRSWEEEVAKVAGIVCLVISVINLGAGGGSFYFITHIGPETKTVINENGVVSVLQEERFALRGL